MNIKNARFKNYSTLMFMMSATVIGKALGMFRDMLLSYYYGTTSMEAKAFVTAARLPLNFFDFALGAAIGSAFIPVFNEIRQREGEERGLGFANEFVNLISMVAIFFAAIGMSFAPFFVKVIAGGLDAETYVLAVSLTRMMFPMLIFTAMAFSFVGILQSYGEFNVPAAISVVSNVIMILYFFLFNDKFGIKGLAIAMVVGWFFQVVVQIPFLGKKGYRFRPTLKVDKKQLARVVTLMLPILISTWAQPINVMVNTYLASFIGDASAVVVLEYANKVFIIISGVFILAIINITFPSMSRYLEERDMKGYSGLIKQALRLITFFMVPMTIGVCIFSSLIIKILYERGAVDSIQSQRIASVFFFYVIGIVFFGVRELINKAFYSAKNTKIPMWTAFIGIIINITLSVGLVRIMGEVGLSLSATISALIMSVILLIQFDRCIHRLLDRKELFYYYKTFQNSVIMGGVVYWINNTMNKSIGTGLIKEILAALVATVVGIVIYFALAKITKLEIPELALHSRKEKIEVEK